MTSFCGFSRRALWLHWTLCSPGQVCCKELHLPPRNAPDHINLTWKTIRVCTETITSAWLHLHCFTAFSPWSEDMEESWSSQYHTIYWICYWRKGLWYEGSFGIKVVCKWGYCWVFEEVPRIEQNATGEWSLWSANRNAGNLNNQLDRRHGERAPIPSQPSFRNSPWWSETGRFCLLVAQVGFW